MTNDIEILREWIRIVVIIAAISASTVPIVYAFYPWRSRPIGRLFMAQAVSFAAALDVTALFSIYRPAANNILILFWVDAIVLTAIAVSNMAMGTFLLMTIFVPSVRQNMKRRNSLHDVK